MKSRSIAAALFLSALLMITGCGGSDGSTAGSSAAEEPAAESIAEEPAAEEAAAENTEEEAAEAEEPAAEEAEPEEEALSVILEDPDREITFELFYPAEGVEVEETDVFGHQAWEFSSESEGCYAILSSSSLYTSDLASRLEQYDNLTYGEHSGWTEYTSYTAEGMLIGNEYGDGLSHLLSFKVGNLEDSPAEREELDSYLQGELVTFLLTNYEVVSETGPAEEAPAEAEEEEGQFGVVDGVAHLTHADAVLPEGWTVVDTKDFSVKLERDEKIQGVGEDDFLTAKLTIETNSSDVPAAEWAQRKVDDFGGDSTLQYETINGVDWIWFSPVEDQVYLFTDTSAGTRVDISVMFLGFDDEVHAIVEGVTPK